MSSHRLDRSSIECGRSSWWKSESRFSHRRNRQNTRRALALAMHDNIHADQLVKKQSWMDLGLVDETFHCKTRLAHDWLALQIGRVWNEVRSEIFQKFGSSRQRQRHLREHLLEWVNESPYHVISNRFQVGIDGVLYEADSFDYPRRSYDYAKPPETWPLLHDFCDFSYFERLMFGRINNWAIVNRQGTAYWVRACAWQTEDHPQGTYSYVTEFCLDRGLTPEELQFLQGLRSDAYRDLFFTSQRMHRQGANNVWRPAKGLSPLPLPVLID
jgi:hypothetical protein